MVLPSVVAAPKWWHSCILLKVRLEAISYVFSSATFYTYPLIGGNALPYGYISRYYCTCNYGIHDTLHVGTWYFTVIDGESVVPKCWTCVIHVSANLYIETDVKNVTNYFWTYKTFMIGLILFAEVWIQLTKRPHIMSLRKGSFMQSYTRIFQFW